MSQESTPSGASGQARRRIVALPERQSAIPVALIAHEGEERDLLENHIVRVRPVVCFPSLAHFDGNGRSRWAGVIVARSHAWDARLDACVLRRAFIALYNVTDEGYGWPDTVKRISSVEELDTFLVALADPVLPPDDRPRVSKPRAKRTFVTMSLAGDDPQPAQLALPAVGSTREASGDPSGEAGSATRQSADGAGSELEARPEAGVRLLPAPSRTVVYRPSEDAPWDLPRRPRVLPPAPAPAAVAVAASPARKGLAGLRLTSADPYEQAVLEAAYTLGVAGARAIVDAVEECERVS